MSRMESLLTEFGNWVAEMDRDDEGHGHDELEQRERMKGDNLVIGGIGVREGGEE